MNFQKVVISIFVCFSLILFNAIFFAANGQDAIEIVKNADEKMRGKSSYIEMTMKIVRPDWSREMSMKGWSKGRDFSLTLITAPARDKGQTFLMRDKEIWNWVPSIERMIKIPPSMMMQSWMGSDFTNDDLVKESSVVEDYTHKIAGEETIENRECYKIELTPKEEAAVVWGKLFMWISKESYLQLRIEYYDEDDFLVQTMLLSDIEELGGRIIPTHLEIIPADEDKKGNKTILTYLSAEFDQEIKDSFFSQQKMKRVR